MAENAPAHTGQKLRLFVRRWTVFHIVLLAVAYVALLAWTFPGFEALLEAWIFLPVGIFGAVVANSTGTGGGVVFVPAFAQLDIRPPQSIAMSFLIQSFGMSVGTLVWLNTFFVSGKVKPADIVLGQRAWPRKVQQVSNAFQNQMETPTLFFVGVILAIILGISGPVLLTLAWVWAGLRVVHAIIHTTSNHLRWRFYSFAGGVFVLLAFWITLAIGIVTR